MKLPPYCNRAGLKKCRKLTHEEDESYTVKKDGAQSQVHFSHGLQNTARILPISLGALPSCSNPSADVSQRSYPQIHCQMMQAKQTYIQSFKRFPKDLYANTDLAFCSQNKR